MYGWRGRLGLLVPSSNTTMEAEFQKLLPEGLSLHTSRMLQVKETEDELLKMREYAKRGAKELASADVDLIIYGCTSGSFLKGEDENQQIKAELEEISAVPVLTTSTAVRKAFDFMGIERLVLVTPYPQETNQKAKKWIESLGYEVSEIIELIHSTYSNPINNLEIGRIFPEIIYKKIRNKCLMKDEDGIFISCTNLRTLKIIERLENDLRINVVTSNQATMWAALKEVGLKSSIQGYGQLFIK